MPPDEASGEPALIGTVTTPLVMVADIVARGDPGIDAAGFPPLHADRTASPLVHAAIVVSCLQNSRRS
jgi:hypothetical protein